MKPYERRFFLLKLTPAGTAVVDQTRRVIEVELFRWFAPTSIRTPTPCLSSWHGYAVDTNLPGLYGGRARSSGTMRAIVLESPARPKASVRVIVVPAYAGAVSDRIRWRTPLLRLCFLAIALPVAVFALMSFWRAP